MALTGGGVVLAATNGFLLAGLDPSRTDDVIPLEIGTPLAQVSAETWWAGWSLSSGNPALWLAQTPPLWRNLAVQQDGLQLRTEDENLTGAMVVIEGFLSDTISCQ